MRSWLSSPALLAPDGRVLSWLSDDKTGYPYDEASILLARLYHWLGWSERAQTILDPLLGRLHSINTLERDGVQYVFDTALALPLLSNPRPVAHYVLGELQSHRACRPVKRPGWWSQSFGAHLIKCAGPLSQLGMGLDVRPIVDELVDGCFDGARFRIHADSQATYVHSHCYALEGLLLCGYHPNIVRTGADWLVGIQDNTGALPAWVNSEEPNRWPADIVAQGIRIWTLLDHRRYADAIQRGLRFLAERQDPESGGIAYGSNLEHWNVWSTIFAYQACAWVHSKPSRDQGRWLI